MSLFRYVAPWMLTPIMAYVTIRWKGSPLQL